MKRLTPEEFLQWIDREIKKAERDMNKNESDGWLSETNGRLLAFQDVKKKYQSILPPHQSLS